MRNFLFHLSRCAASALARQIAFADFLGARGWGVDIGTGAVSFGRDLRFPIQLLGTESDGDRTWLWAWANGRSPIPPEILRAVHWLREYGRQNQIDELSQASVPLAHADGHLLALLASGITGRCYYRGPYEGGALFFLVEDVPPAVLAPVPPERTVAVLTQVLQMVELDHRTLVESFLSQQGYAVTRTAAAIVARHPGGSGLQVGLDQRGPDRSHSVRPCAADRSSPGASALRSFSRAPSLMDPSERARFRGRTSNVEGAWHGSCESTRSMSRRNGIRSAPLFAALAALFLASAGCAMEPLDELDEEVDESGAELGSPYDFQPIAPCMSVSHYVPRGVVRFGLASAPYTPACLRLATGGTVVFQGSFLEHPLELRPVGTTPSPIQPTSAGGWAEFEFSDFGFFAYRCGRHPRETGVIWASWAF